VTIDAGREIDWGRTSRDYARHRPGPPESFYARLKAHGIGLPDQRLVDLGTGTGLLARVFARRGCRVSALDVSPEQIGAARQLASEEAIDVDFRIAPAEETPFAAGRFDIVTANQCWPYFDLERLIPELRRILVPEGLLVVSHFSFLPRLDPVARASERLVLKFNPDWEGADWDGHLPARPGWSREAFDLRVMFWYDEPIEFTRESWRGRFRALRGVGATLAEDEVRAFDSEHAALLERITEERFRVLHRIHASVFAFRGEPDTD